MSEIHLLPTNPTTDLTGCAGILDAPTSDSTKARFLQHGHVTPSDWDWRIDFHFDKPSRAPGEIQIGLDHELTQQGSIYLSGSTSTDIFPQTEHFQIESLGEAGYRILKPISVEIRRVGPGDFLASFREGNISISGSDSQDSYQALVAEILDTFDVLTGERKLGPDASEQLRILNTYIVRT